jgi:hypothetical protein
MQVDVSKELHITIMQARKVLKEKKKVFTPKGAQITDPAFRFNLHIMVHVMMKINPINQGYCRSAGCVGFTAYEELVERRSLFTVSCCAEVAKDDGDLMALLI